MTTTQKPVRRETLTAFRGKRLLIVELRGTYLVIREKGLRRGYTVPYLDIYTLGAQNAAQLARAERAEARRLRGRR